MKFVKNESFQIIEVKKSKFIAYLFPYEHFKKIMAKLKAEHPKARHFVYAYRHINTFDQIVENQSDDGEPRGSSGKPALTVLRGNELVNTAVIIVRYFGGTKLGVGGLVRAYSDSVNAVIKSSNLKEYIKKITNTFVVNIKNLSKTEYILASYDDAQWNKKFEENFVKLCLNSSEETFKEILKRLDNLVIKDEAST